MKKIFSFFAAIMMTVSLFADKTLYLVPNSNWNQSNARFAAYYFGGSGSATWADMTATADHENTYEVTIPTGFTTVIFCRMNPGTSTNNWDNKWNQTDDLTIPTNDNNCYTVKDGTWDKGGGVWSVLGGETPEVITYTFANGSTWYFDFTAVTGGANWPSATGAGLYDGNAGGNVKPTTFSQDIVRTLGEGWGSLKTQKGNWTNIALPNELPAEGVNCVVIAADGVTASWGTYSPEPEPEPVLEDITVRVYTETGAPLIWWWGGGIPGANETYTWETRPAMIQEGETNWYAWTFENVNVQEGISYKITATAEKEFTGIKEDKCFDANLAALDCGYTPDPVVTAEFVFEAGEANVDNVEFFVIAFGEGVNDTKKMTTDEEREEFKAELDVRADSVVIVRAAAGAESLIWDGEDKNVYNQTANALRCDTMYFEAFVPETALFTVTCVKPEPTPDPEPETELVFTVTVPEGTENCFIAGNITGWSFTQMTPVAGEENLFTITLEAGRDTAAYKYAYAANWESVEKGEGGIELENRTYNENDVVIMWAEKPAEKVYSLIGYINGADYGCNADYENPGEYLFVNGKLTMNFTETSYVFVKTTDNASWFMSETFVLAADEATATLKTASELVAEKVGVPAGAVTFTLVENEDGSLTLSYVKDAPANLENAAIEAVAKKAIVNGQLIITRDGKRYNAIGVRL